MLRALSSQEPPLTLVRLIHGETDGNPFFIEEVFQHLAEEGRLFGADGRFRRELLISELDVPESVRIVVGRRLERLTEDARRALAAAAVVGRAFTFELLEAMGDLGSEALLDALDQGERARLVLPLSEEASETRLLFAHELIRQTLLSELSQPRRRRLHLRAAKAIERLYADSLEDHASEIAHHLAQAGPAADAEKLLRYLTLAGRQAMAASGFEEALRHFEYAFSLRELADAVQLADLLVDLARARRSLGRWEEALATWQEAVEARQALEEGGGVAEVCYEASQDLWWINRDEEAFAMAQRGLLALGEDAGPQRAQMLAWAGAAGAFITPYDVGADMIDEALVLAEQLGDTRLLGHTLAAKAVHLFPFYHHGELVEAGLEGATLLRSAGDLWEATWALSLAELGLVVLGRMEHAREVGAEVAPLIDRLGHYGALFLHIRAQGPREFIAGADLDRYEAFARQDLETRPGDGTAGCLLRLARSRPIPAW
jgi:tetratricopeptide (TPR) repeat protein